MVDTAVGDLRISLIGQVCVHVQGLQFFVALSVHTEKHTYSQLKTRTTSDKVNIIMKRKKKKL